VEISRKRERERERERKEEKEKAFFSAGRRSASMC